MNSISLYCHCYSGVLVCRGTAGSTEISSEFYNKVRDVSGGIEGLLRRDGPCYYTILEDNIRERKKSM